VILYSAFADASMTVPAIVAGADGILNKGVPARELFEAIREVARGGDALPAISTEMLEVASLALDDEDLPILGMLIDRTPPHDIADTLRLELPALRWRTERMLGRLQASVGRVRHPLDARADESRPVWVDSPPRPRNLP
jgi:DNA-binding NarL/FixJ family response regulator